MPLDQCINLRLRGSAWSSGPSQTESHLDRINIERVRIVERMEQQAFLQRRERKDVVYLQVLALQPLDLVLG